MVRAAPHPNLPDKDIKILWARAAGLCSFPECKKNLTRFSRRGKAFHIGENAHMAAFSLKGPRARGGMSPAERDSYSNHILLCPTCHTMVDKNKTDYSLNRLRTFKLKHESWVAESLYAHSSHIGPSAAFYRSLLERLEEVLHLKKWPWLIDHLWRDMFPDRTLGDAGEVAGMAATMLWPGTRPRLERSFRAVMEAWLKYCQHFETFAEPHSRADFLVRERPYENAPGDVVHQFHVKADKWSRRNKQLLIDYVATLNKMVDAVREDLDPSYRENRGYFPLLDVAVRGSEGPWIVVPKRTRQEIRVRRLAVVRRLRGPRRRQRPSRI